jgi:hypothetical protein
MTSFPPACFLIVSLRRCGSTFLECELDSHEHVACLGEFAMREEDKLKKTHIRILPEAFSFREAILGFERRGRIMGSKLTIPEYHAHKVARMMEFLLADPVAAVHITRPFHEQMVSLAVAKRSGLWTVLESDRDAYPAWLEGEIGCEGHRSAEKIRKEPLAITPDEVRAFCRAADGIDRLVAGLKGRVPYYHVRYENLAGRIEDILDFLADGRDTGLRIRQQALKRMIDKDHRSLVTNWDEVAGVFEEFESRRDYRREQGGDRP